MMAKTSSASSVGRTIGSLASEQAGARDNEAMLNAFVDQYLSALAKRDPSRLPLASNVRFTENTRPLAIGDGLWATATGIGAYRHYFSDVTAGQAGVFAVIEENGTPGLLALRLKIDNAEICEAETIVVREQEMGQFLRTDATKVKAIWLETLAPSERMSRDEMIRSVDLYFDGLNKGDGDMVPFDEDCVRTENGTQTANNPPSNDAPSMFPSHPELRLGEMSCREQFNTGLVKYIQEVDPRRFVIVDEAKGLVFGFFIFRHPGTITEVNVPDVGPIPMIKAALYPFDVEVAELFKLKNGKICEIEAVMVSLPYRSDTGWDH